MDIILYLLNYIKYQNKIIGQLLNFICRYIPLKQWAFDDSHSPKYQKFIEKNFYEILGLFHSSLDIVVSNAGIFFEKDFVKYTEEPLY